MRNLAAFIFVLSVIVCLPQLNQAFAGNEAALDNAYRRWEEFEKQGNYHEAIRYAEQAVRLEKEFDPFSEYVGGALNHLGVLYQRLGNYDEAERSHSLALKILENKFGSEHLDVATVLYDFAWLHFSQGRHLEAEVLFKRARVIQEIRLGPRHLDVANTLSALATLYLEQGRYDSEAEHLYLDALESQEAALGRDHPDALSTINGLAALYWSQARYAKAEPLFRQVLNIQEINLGYHHPDLSITLNYLGLLYLNQGLYEQAEALLKRSLKIKEKALGLGHPSVATGLSDLAWLYSHQNRYTEAEVLLERALNIQENSVGPSHPHVALTVSALAEIFSNQQRYLEAENLYQRAIHIYEEAFGHEHPHIANLLNDLAWLYWNLGQKNELEPLLMRALGIQETMLGLTHPSLAYTLSSLARLHHNKSQYKQALAWARRGTDILQTRFMGSVADKTEGLRNEQREARKLFYMHIALAYYEMEGNNREQLKEESFEVAQLAHSSAAGAAIASVAARFSSGDGELALAVREQQDAIMGWRTLDKALIEEVGKPAKQRDTVIEATLREALKETTNKLSKLENYLAQEFPSYAELTASKPLPSSDIQELLSKKEALISYLITDNATFIWVLRHNAMHMIKVEVDAEEVEELVTDLRFTLEPFDTEIIDFDTEQSHVLYDKIFAPIKPYIVGVKHLIVVPDGSLESIPFSVLVSKKLEPDEIKSLNNYKDISWLGLEYAFTTLPSVSSLKALRMFSQLDREKKSRPFIGFGDPILEGMPSSERGSSHNVLFNRGAVANVSEVRKLSSLPDTADELRLIANSLGTDETALYLGKKATEETVKSTDLSGAKVIAFATHGLVSGELAGLVEPGLILTPPEIGTNVDDGVLSASEVAELTLFPGLVILSACNTASSDGTPDAGGLSGLAKAFFYAGSRTLLVSHWAVPSEAAKHLTTEMFRVLSEDSTMGPAEALKRSMAVLIMDKDNPRFSHPLFWAPFVVVGEGTANSH